LDHNPKVNNAPLHELAPGQPLRAAMLGARTNNSFNSNNLAGVKKKKSLMHLTGLCVITGT
jgi:hypothetical protein